MLINSRKFWNLFKPFGFKFDYSEICLKFDCKLLHIMQVPTNDLFFLSPKSLLSSNMYSHPNSCWFSICPQFTDWYSDSNFKAFRFHHPTPVRLRLSQRAYCFQTEGFSSASESHSPRFAVKASDCVQWSRYLKNLFEFSNSSVFVLKFKIRMSE